MTRRRARSDDSDSSEEEDVATRRERQTRHGLVEGKLMQEPEKPEEALRDGIPAAEVAAMAGWFWVFWAGFVLQPARLGGC